MNEENLFKKIHENYAKQLKYLKIPHQKFVICFSGIPGSGKTYVAKILEKRYKGVRIRNDDVRRIYFNLAKKYKLNKDDVDVIVDRYLEWFFEDYSFKNKLIIIDGDVDRRYERFFPFIKKRGYNYFIIRIKASRETLEKRIFEKDNSRNPHFDSEIERWTKEWKEFGKKVKSDIIIENENKLHLKPLFLKLDKLVR